MNCETQFDEIMKPPLADVNGKTGALSTRHQVRYLIKISPCWNSIEYLILTIVVEFRFNNLIFLLTLTESTVSSLHFNTCR